MYDLFPNNFVMITCSPAVPVPAPMTFWLITVAACGRITRVQKSTRNTPPRSPGISVILLYDGIS